MFSWRESVISLDLWTDGTTERKQKKNDRKEIGSLELTKHQSRNKFVDDILKGSVWAMKEIQKNAQNRTN